MFQFDAKLLVIGALFLALVLVKLFAGGRPLDGPVRRRRRFGYRGTEGPLADPDARARPPAPPAPPAPASHEPPKDPEAEFFKDDPKR